MFGFGSRFGENDGPLAVANIAALQALPVLNALPTGWLIFVISTGRIFVLRPSLGVAVTDNGVSVLATADDATRQWVWDNLFTSLQSFETAKLTMTATITNAPWIPAMPGLMFIEQPSAAGRFVTTDWAGTLTTGATSNAGNDAAKANIRVSAVSPTAASVTNAAGLAGGVPPFDNVSLGANSSIRDLVAPVLLDITIAATGVGLTWKGKYVVTGKIVLSTDLA